MLATAKRLSIDILTTDHVLASPDFQGGTNLPFYLIYRILSFNIIVNKLQKVVK